MATRNHSGLESRALGISYLKGSQQGHAGKSRVIPRLLRVANSLEGSLERTQVRRLSPREQIRDLLPGGKGDHGRGGEGQRQRVVPPRRLVGEQGEQEVEVAVVAQRAALDKVGQEVVVDLLSDGVADAARDLHRPLRRVVERALWAVRGSGLRDGGGI